MGKVKLNVDASRVDEIRLGRNYVRKGDLVRIAPPDGSPPGTHGSIGRFQFAETDRGGQFVCVILHEKDEKGLLVACGFRFVKPERIERKATTHDPRRQAEERAQARREERK